MEKLANFIIRYRTAIIIILIGVTIFMGIQIKNARFNPDMMTYLPEDMPSRVNQKKIEDIFGGTEMIMLVLKTEDVINAETLERIKKISREMKKIKGIEKVMSLFDLKQVRSENEAIIVDPAVKMTPRTKEEIEIIKKEIIENDLVYGSVVSKDFTTTAVIGMIEPGTSDKIIVGQLEKLIKQIPGKEETLLGGSPYLRKENGASMQRDISRLLPLGLFLMFVFLLIGFRQFRGVWLSSLMVIIAIIISLGFIPLLGWDFTIVTIILPVMMIAMANNYGVHMFARFQDDNTPGNSFTSSELSGKMITNVGKPVVIDGLTTIAGLLCMMGHILIPAWQMGILGSIGITAAIIATLFFIPAVNSLLPKPKPFSTPVNNESGGNGIIDKLISLIIKLVAKKPGLIILVFVFVTIFFSFGISRLSINTNPSKMYPTDHPAKLSSELINEKLGGFFPLSIVFEGDLKNPQLLKRIDEIEKKINSMPEVGVTQSIAKVSRQISRALNSKTDSQFNKIPDTYEAVSQYFELYLMSGDPADLEKMVDFSFEKAMILVRFKDMNTPVLRKCVGEIKEMLKNEPSAKYIGGNADIFSEMDNQIVKGQFLSLAFSLLTVFVIVAISFKSIKEACLQNIPLVIAIVLLFGVMGFTGIELNFATALLSSIMVGIGIDYATHFLWRYREEIRKGYVIQDAIKRTLQSTGRGIIFSAVSVIIGFGSLMFSSFMNVRFFGLLMVIMIFACLISGILLIPALCMAVGPKFLEPETNKEIPDSFLKVNKTEDSFEQA